MSQKQYRVAARIMGHQPGDYVKLDRSDFVKGLLDSGHLELIEELEMEDPGRDTMEGLEHQEDLPEQDSEEKKPLRSRRKKTQTQG